MPMMHLLYSATMADRIDFANTLVPTVGWVFVYAALKRGA